MAERTEEQLARALKAAASLAPEPAADLALLVAARRRRRRRRRRMQVLLAVTGVVAVIGTAMTAARGAFHFRHPDVVAADPQVNAARPPDGTADAVSFAPARQVWPDAVFRMPAKARDGFAYRPVTALGPTEVLLSAESPTGHHLRLEVYDTTTGTTRVIAKAIVPAAMLKYHVQGWDVDERHIAWYATAERRFGEEVTLFWAVPREGGTARLVRAVSGEPAAQVDRIALTGDGRLAYSTVTGGVYTMPLDGPPDRSTDPAPVPGAEDLYLQQWPWAGDRPAGYGADPGRNQGVVVNLETGERRPVRAAADVRAMRCGPTWCVGERRGDDGLMRAVVQRLDGTQRRELDGLRAYPALDGLIDDRFAVLSVTGGDAAGTGIEVASPPVAVVHDIGTGVTAAVGATEEGGGGSFGRGASSTPSAVLYWNVTGRSGKLEEYWVLNLAAVR